MRVERGVGRLAAAARAIAAQSASSRTSVDGAAAGSAGSRSSSGCLRHQHGGAGVGQHEGQPLGRVVRIERQVGAAGLEDAEQPDHHLGERSTQSPTTVSGPTPSPRR